MKKHELLEKSMRDYPKGTKCISTHKIEFESSGIFWIDDTGSVADISGRCIYSKIDESWAEIVSDKKPLLISEDGVELFEGDYCYVAVFKCNKWFLDDHTDGGDSERFEVSNNGKFINTDKEKHFKDKQSALEWIESQKPKIIEIEGKLGYIALVERVFVTWKYENIPRKITQETVGNILKAMEELNA